MPRVTRSKLKRFLTSASIAFRLLNSILLLLASVSPAWSYKPGAWSPRSHSWGGSAVHMALLRGDGSPYHSRVIWWQSEGATSADFIGGQWGWKSGVGLANCSTYPESALIAITLPAPDDNIFCAGLTETSRGQLCVIGGTEPGTENGLRGTNIFRVGGLDSAGVWTACDLMASWRYYGSALTLADGRIAAFSGNKYTHIEFFGGRKDGETLPTKDSLLRFAPAFNGIWDAPGSKTEGSPWPPPLTGLTGLSAPRDGKLQYYGGRDSTGALSSKVWGLNRNPNGSGADYTYDWADRTPSEVPEPAPDPRMDHVAMMIDFGTDTTKNNMIIFGGLAKPQLGSEAATNDVWRHYGRPSPDSTHKHTRYRWAQLRIGGTPPSARLGHTGFFDEDHYRMLVFGGRSSTSVDPTDTDVYALKFYADNPDSATWSKPTVRNSTTHPSARFDHSMEADIVKRPKYDDDTLKAGVLFGGHGTGTTAYHDVWKLWLHGNGDVEWEEVSLSGTPPSLRSDHTGTFESGSGRLIVFGGVDGSGAAADDVVWVADLHSASPAWHQFATKGYSLAGATAVIAGVAFARSPEFFTESTNDWAQSSSGHEQSWYPQMFQMPNGKVFEAGPATDSYTFNPSDGAWARFPADTVAPESVIVGGGAVMYLPGKVMKCGAREIEGNGNPAYATTKYIDLGEGSPAWHSAGSMAVSRVTHNLVLLPTGDVLVTGGMGVIDDEKYVNPRLRPEIWSPATHLWSGGVAPDTLMPSTVPRGYHSTSLLLPDGRVLCAGGKSPADDVYGDVFCPPYLFSADTLARRPTLLGATERWRYNADVTFAVKSDTAHPVRSDTLIRRACLIHPGATTHAQDQAQRYVPLTLLTSSVRGDGVRQYLLKAPADSAIAPPGDYLLFVSDSAGVPAVARWVRVGNQQGGQYDKGAPNDFSLAAEVITCSSIDAIGWSAPGDDGAVGTALEYDIRYSSSAINTSNFASATPLGSLPIPLYTGTYQNAPGLTGLSHSTTVYVAGRTLDKAGNWSPLATASFTTLSSCDDGGGHYGEAAGRPREEATGLIAAAPGARTFAPSTSLIGQNTSLRLVGDYTKGESSRWRVRIEDFAADTSLLAATAGGMVFREPGPGGTWLTRRTIASPGGSIGVRSLVSTGQVIFPAGSTLEAVELSPRSYAIASATHSRLGDLADTTLAMAPDLAAGDTVTIAYGAATNAGAGDDCVFRVTTPAISGATQRRTGPPAAPSEALPKTFAFLPPRPNPFRSTLALRFDLPVASEVRLEIFDVLGRHVADVARGTFSAGRQVTTWNGTLASGDRAPAGVYLCRMSAGSFHAERRFVLVP